MDISLYGNNRTALSDLSISAISKHCTSLFLLRIENSLRITDDAILQLLSLRCPKLQVLYLKNCIEITNRVVDSFSKYLHTYYVIDCPQVHGSRRSKKHVLLSKQKSEVNEPNSDNCYNCETTVKSANSERRTNNWMANYDDSYENNLVGDSLRSRFGSSGRNNYYESSNSDIIPDYALDDEYVTLYTTGIHKNVRNGSDFYLTKFEIFFTIMMLATSIVGTAFVFVLVVVGEDKILNRAQQISGRGSVSNSITTFLQTTLITVLLLAVLLTSSMAFQTLNKSK